MNTKITKPEWIDINQEELTITLFGAPSEDGVEGLPFLATSEEIKFILADPLNGILSFLNKKIDIDEILETV